MNLRVWFGTRVGPCILPSLLALAGLAIPMLGHTAESLKIVTEHFPPYNYLKDGRVVGFASEVVQACQAIIKQHDKIEVMPWPRAYRQALSDEKVMIYSINRIPSREPLFKWAGPVAEFQVMVFAPKGIYPPFTTFAQLRQNRSIAATRDSAISAIMIRNGFNSLSLSNTPKLNIMKTLKGRVDMWLGGRGTTLYQLEEIGLDDNDFEAVGHLFTAELHLGFSKSVSDSTVEEWQAALQQIKQDGTYEKLLQKYQHYFNWSQHKLPVLLKNE